MIDDALSCSQLEFLGSGTRKFYNNRDKTDKRNGKMCTVPVRMDFKNKETRIQAETTLQSICKVKCSIPYPRKLRTMINETSNIVFLSDLRLNNSDCVTDLKRIFLSGNGNQYDFFFNSSRNKKGVGILISKKLDF